MKQARAALPCPGEEGKRERERPPDGRGQPAAVWALTSENPLQVALKVQSPLVESAGRHGHCAAHGCPAAFPAASGAVPAPGPSFPVPPPGPKLHLLLPAAPPGLPLRRQRFENRLLSTRCSPACGSSRVLLHALRRFPQLYLRRILNNGNVALARFIALQLLLRGVSQTEFGV